MSLVLRTGCLNSCSAGSRAWSREEITQPRLVTILGRARCIDRYASSCVVEHGERYQKLHAYSGCDEPTS